MSTMTSSTQCLPTQSAERIPLLDILRGFALFGILIVNMYYFSHPIQETLFAFDARMLWIDQVVSWFILLLAESKFYTLFSLLFGVGLALQMERIQAKGQRFVPLYLRRLTILLGMGLVHTYLIWVGDILTVYALLGFVLLLYRNAKPRTLLIWVNILLSLIILFYISLFWLISFDSQNNPYEILKETENWEIIEEDITEIEWVDLVQEVEDMEPTDLEQAYQVYSTGNFAEITTQRMADMHSLILGSLLAAPEILVLFLIGLYLGRRKIFNHVDEHLPLLYRLFWWGLGLGIIGNFIYATWSVVLLQEDFPLMALVVVLAQLIGSLALSGFYIATITLLCRRAVWQRYLHLLAPVGRMALTNYLSQSIICTLIFYGYGFGLFGQVGVTLGVVLAVFIYVSQVLFSIWWTQRFYFGPIEWLWRSLTYMKWQPFRIVS